MMTEVVYTRSQVLAALDAVLRPLLDILRSASSEPGAAEAANFQAAFLGSLRQSLMDELDLRRWGAVEEGSE